MTAAKRRFVRMMCKAALLISLPLAGFVWALPENSAMLMSAGALTLLSLLVGFGAEYLASSTENEIQEVTQQIATQRERRVSELEIRDEKIRQFDRIVNLLTEQNHTLRAKLVSAQIEVQQKKDMLLKAAGEALSLEDAAPLRNGLLARAN
jgi:hypothetical protein